MKDRYKGYTPGHLPIGDRNTADTMTGEAINGLVGLGYSISEASEMVGRVYMPESSLEDLIKNALISVNPLKGR